MDGQEPPEERPDLRAALEALRNGAAGVEAVIYAEKCATLPRLSVAEGLMQFAELYQMAIAMWAGVQPHPALEALHIAETVAINERFGKIAGRRPKG